MQSTRVYPFILSHALRHKSRIDTVIFAYTGTWVSFTTRVDLRMSESVDLEASALGSTRWSDATFADSINAANFALVQLSYSGRHECHRPQVRIYGNAPSYYPPTSNPQPQMSLPYRTVRSCPKYPSSNMRVAQSASGRRISWHVRRGFGCSIWR